MKTEEGKNLPVEHCINHTKGWEICDALKPYVDNRHVFAKLTFGSIDLGDYLDEGLSSIAYDEIVLIGVCTGICVLSQAVMCKSAQPNAHIVVDAACCACVTPHTHDVAIEAMKTLQVEIRNEGKEPWRE
jgi:nicotinamidase-related amidase